MFFFDMNQFQESTLVRIRCADGVRVQREAAPRRERDRSGSLPFRGALQLHLNYRRGRCHAFGDTQSILH